MTHGLACALLARVRDELDELEDALAVECACRHLATRTVLRALSTGVRLRLVLERVDAPDVLRTAAKLDERWRELQPEVQRRRGTRTA